MKKFKWSILVIIVQILLSLFLGLQFQNDAKIPSHWNIKGEIDGYVGKWTGIFLFPGINLAVLLLLIALPYISVRYEKADERFDKIIPALALIIVFFFACIHIYSLLLARGIVSEVNRPLYLLIGLMFVLLGNILPKIPSNFFAGIRTPWTLSSEIVWRKTHRIGGFCFVLAGFLMIILPLFWKNSSNLSSLMFVLVILIVLYPALYSFLLFKKQGNKK